jgi:hypothetical protein
MSPVLPTERITQDTAAGGRCTAEFCPAYDRLESDSVIRRCRLNVRFPERTRLDDL